MSLKDIVNIDNIITLIRALRNEPLDIVFINGINKIIGKPPINSNQSFILKTKYFIKNELRILKSKLQIRRRIKKLNKIYHFTILFYLNDNNYDEADIKKFVNSIERIKYPNFSFAVCGNYEFPIMDNGIKVKTYNNFENYTADITKSETDYIVLFDRVAYLYSDSILEIAERINETETIFFTNHWNTSIKSKQHNIKQNFSLDYFLAYDYIKSPIIISKKNFPKLKPLVSKTNLSLLNQIILSGIVHKFQVTNLNFACCSIPKEKDISTSRRVLERKKQIKSFIEKYEINATVELTDHKEVFYIDRKVITDSMVSIIIPFKDEVDMTLSCVKSLIEKTYYLNYEIILISNNSKSFTTKKVLEFSKNNHAIKFYEYNTPFNYSEINNWGVDKARGEYLLFLNNDTEVINHGWLINMCKHIQRDDVGVVGSLLLYPDNSVQHAGVLIGVGDFAGHSHRFIKYGNPGYMNRLICEQDYEAVTGACLLTKRKLFIEVGGFDSENLPISNNDVDLCLKIKNRNKKVIWTPRAILYHFDSKTRSSDYLRNEAYTKELNYMYSKYGNLKSNLTEQFEIINN